MKTDTLFYELFQTAPQTFFELLQITPSCPYRFESITVKTAEKRIDGVLEPTIEGNPIYFVEVQGFPDDVIYWRSMREVATFFEQRPHLKASQWQAIVLWLNQEDDPGFETLLPLAEAVTPRLVSIDLISVLKKLDEDSLTFNVLRPLIAETEQEVRQNVIQWIENIQKSPTLDDQAEERLIEVLTQIIEQRFQMLTYKEIAQMLRLTPLKETQSYKEAFKEEYVEILTGQVQIKFDVSDEMLESIRKDLSELDLRELRILVKQILRLGALEQLETWIEDHKPS